MFFKISYEKHRDNFEHFCSRIWQIIELKLRQKRYFYTNKKKQTKKNDH